MARFHVRQQAADIAAAVRVWPRLSRLHRTLRICAVDALARRRGADRASMARRLSRRRYHAALADAIATFPPEQLADLLFTAHPATRMVRSQFAARDDLRRQPRYGTGQDRSSVDTRGRLITRPEFEVAVRRLPPGGAVFLTSLISGHSLGEAAACGVRTLRRSSTSPPTSPG